MWGFRLGIPLPWPSWMPITPLDSLDQGASVARRIARILVMLGVFFGAAAVGFAVAPRLASESLRLDAEKRLTELIGTPVTIGDVHLAVGFGIRLEGSDVLVWRGETHSPSLQIDRIRAGLRPEALLFGQVRFGRIVLDGARLRIERSTSGHWSPEPIARYADRDAEASEPGASQPDELLSPLIRLENSVRAILEKPVIANQLELRNATIVFIDARAEDPLAPPLFLALESFRAELRRSRLTRTNRLSIQARLVDAQGDRGAVEWEGTRSRRGAIRVAMAVTDLQLEALAPYVRSRHPDARVEGRISGAVVFDTASPGNGRIELDLVGHRLLSVEPRPSPTSVSVERLEASGTLEITPQTVRLQAARLRGGATMLEADGTIARPLRPSSFAQFALAFQEVDVAEVRHLIGWLPEVEREEAESIVAVVESGRLHSLRAGGAATLSGWQAFLAGRTRTPPADFFLDATLADTVVHVGEDDRLEDLRGRLWWSGSRAEVQEVRARLNGTPLPIFDVVVEDVTNFLVGDPERRRLVSGGLPLRGLRTLWESFQPDPDEPEPPDVRIALGLDVAHLHHPMFLWPIENAAVAIWDTDQGLHIITSGGTWAGVPVSGEADWLFEPEERVRVHLTAEPPEGTETPRERPTSTAWAEGVLTIGMLQEGGPWKQQYGISHFSAHAGEFRLDSFKSALNPAGKLEASIELDLALPDAVPFEVNFDLDGGNVAALAEQLGQPPEVGTGSVDIAGSFRGALRPDAPLVDGLSGLLDVRAVDGTIRRSVPAVLAVALASEAYNPFARREEIRYERCETVLEFEDGRMSTNEFSMDGPDVRVFASGELDLLNPPHEVDAQVALFLFRQIDKILDKIPIVNVLLLGTNDNLMGAHFELRGPWDDPDAIPAPLNAFASGPVSIIEQGPTSLVLQSVPMFMLKGIRAIESMLGVRESSKQKRVRKGAEVIEPNES